MKDESEIVVTVENYPELLAYVQCAVGEVAAQMPSRQVKLNGLRVIDGGCAYKITISGEWYFERARSFNMFLFVDNGLPCLMDLVQEIGAAIMRHHLPKM